MSSRSALDLSTRTVKIYASAFDATARANIDAHLADNDNPHSVTAEQIGLGAVDNTSDANKPVSGPQAAALALKANLASPALSGVPTAPTAVLGTTTSQLATTQFVQAAINANAAGDADTAGDLAEHLADTANPHAVTASQVGLGNVDDTADLDKPVSTATQTAINAANAATGAVAADLAEHLADTANPHAVTASQVGLGNVDDTADLDKPVSSAQQAAINVAAAAAAAAQADIDTHTADTDNPHAVNAADIGLGNVDNTSDAAKPISDATQIALNLKAPLLSPALTGTPTAPTAAPGTNTTQLATTAYVDAADTAQAADITAAADAADAAQAAADAAQADATQALADAAAAQAAADAADVSAQVPSRPGDAVALYGETKTGEPEDVVPIDPAWVAVSPAGSVVRVTAATADDPQTVATATAFPLEPGRVYEVRWRVQRQVNPADPLNDSVTVGLAWLTNTKAANGATVVENIALVGADGVQQRRARIGIAPGAAVVLDYTAPANTIYVRPYVDCFGDAHTSDVITIDFLDITPTTEPQQIAVNVVAPVSGATLTLTDLRPVYVNNPDRLAALTIRLPAVAAGVVEISFANPVTTLAMQDADGVALPAGPVNAFGPGAALLFRYAAGLGWLYWK